MKFACITMIGEDVAILPSQYDVQKFGRKFLNLIILGYGSNYPMEDELLQYILLNCSPNLLAIRFEHVMLQKEQLQLIKHMFHRAHTVVLHKCGMVDDFYDCLLKDCHRLKHLIISETYPIGDKWMQMSYPRLESVQICSVIMTPFQSDPWIQFLHKNPQLKNLSCDRWHSMDASDQPVRIIAKNAVNLERLYISMNGIDHLNDSFGDLRILDKLDRFKCLELQFNGEMGKVNLRDHQLLLVNLKVLRALHFNRMTLTKETCQPPLAIFPIIASFINLKQLNFNRTTFDADFAETVSKKLLNLEEIYSDSPLNDFTAFIQNSPKLKKIELMNTAFGGLNLGWGISWLSDERMKLPQACPLTIFVKNLSAGDAEHSIISSGLIAIMPLVQDKRIILKAKNTFVKV